MDLAVGWLASQPAVKKARAIALENGLRIDEVLAETDPVRRAVREAGALSPYA